MEIDGCKAGWFFVCLEENGHGSCGLLGRIEEVSDYLSAVEGVLIDIPIGLRREHPDERLCDTKARSVLQRKRGSSVFPAPSRCALACESYADASARNRACTGRGLSKQTFAILPKIREVDEFLCGEANRKKLREMHPEVCFWALNGHRPMSFSKRSTEGHEERMALLSRYCPGARDIAELAGQRHKRAQVARDDIVDALVGAVVSMHSKTLRSFPQTPEIDEMGLPMEIVYWEP